MEKAFASKATAYLITYFLFYNYVNFLYLFDFTYLKNGFQM